MRHFVIGDGTAPKGWPAYAAHGEDGIQCRFNGCGHTGSRDVPSQMDCEGRNCSCSCCRMLAGETVHGVKIGGRD